MGDADTDPIDKPIRPPPKGHAMNTNRCLTHLTVVTALVAAAFMLQSRPAFAAPADAANKVIELPRVVVTGKRLQVVELPRVVVTGRRVDGETTRVVQNAPAKPAAAKPV
jgi:hypothetical protein